MGPWKSWKVLDGNHPLQVLPILCRFSAGLLWPSCCPSTKFLYPVHTWEAQCMTGQPHCLSFHYFEQSLHPWSAHQFLQVTLLCHNFPQFIRSDVYVSHRFPYLAYSTVTKQTGRDGIWQHCWGLTIGLPGWIVEILHWHLASRNSTAFHIV